jgi:hypothetical protein
MQCKRCKVDKDVSEFGRSVVTRSGYECWCRDCKAGYYRGRPSRLSVIRRLGPVCQGCGETKPEEELRMVGELLTCRSCGRQLRLAAKHRTTNDHPVQTVIAVHPVDTPTTEGDELA